MCVKDFHVQGQADAPFAGAGIGKVSCIEKGKQYDSECQQAHRYTGILQ